MKECVLCKTRYQKGSGVTFHKFPTDNRRLKLWLKNINKLSWRPKKYDYICSKHFSDDCYIKHHSCTTLKKCSIPTILCSSAVKMESSDSEEICIVSKTSIDVRDNEDELESVETGNVVPKLEPEDDPTQEATLDSDVTHVNLMDIFKVEREGVEMTPVKIESNEEEISKISVDVGEYEDELESVETSNVVPKLEPEDVPTQEATLDSDVTHVNLMDIFKVEREGVEMTPGAPIETKTIQDKGVVLTQESKISNVTTTTETAKEIIPSKKVSSTLHKSIAKRVNTKKPIKTKGTKDNSLNYLFLCDYCNCKFRSKILLKRHVGKHTITHFSAINKVGKNINDSCPKTNSQTQLVVETSVVNTIYKVQAISQSIKPCNTHTAITEKQFRCTQCEKRFNKNYILIHMRTHTGEKPYSCTQCDKSFAQQPNLIRHMRTHTDEKPYSCTYCDKSFTQNGDLKIHSRTHTGEKPYSCTQCEKCFTENGSLIRHIRTHTGEKPYSCTQCEKSFTENGSLIRHIRTHTGSKPYSCTQCGKCFTDSGHLTNHVKTHTGVKPYSCTQCEKSFAQQSTLTRHMRTHTGETLCDKSFSVIGSLMRHMRSHTCEEPYSCTQCDKSFARNSALKVHMRTHTDEKHTGYEASETIP